MTAHAPGDEVARKINDLEAHAQIMLQRYEESGNEDEIASAIDLVNQALLLTPENGHERAEALAIHGSMHSARYNKIGQEIDFQTAVGSYRTAAQCGFEEPSSATWNNHNLGIAYLSRYRNTHAIEDFEISTDFLKKALATHNGALVRGWECSEIAAAYGKKYSVTGSLEDLDKAIEYDKEALDLGYLDDAEYHQRRAAELSRVAYQYHKRYNRTKAIADLDTAIDLEQQAANLNRHCSDSPEYADNLRTLSLWYDDKHEETRTPAELGQAIRLLQQLLDLKPQNRDISLHAGNFALLGEFHQKRYVVESDIADLDAAIRLWSQAVDLTPEDDPVYVDRLSTLGYWYQLLFDHSKSVDTIDLAVQAHERVILLTTGNHPRRKFNLWRLGWSLCARYKIAGNMDDLESGLQFEEEALLMMTPDDGTDIVENLTAFASQLNQKFDQTQDLTDLEAGIEALQKALMLGPKTEDSLGNLHQSLAEALHAKYIRTGDELALENSLISFQKALDLTPESHILKAERFANFGNVYSDKYRGSGVFEDIEKAIECHKNALLLTPEDDEDKPSRLYNLGNTYHQRYKAHGTSHDLDAALACYERSLAITPIGITDLANLYENLGGAYLSKYRLTDHVSDNEKVILYCQKSLELTPTHSLNQANCLQILAIGYASEYARSKSPATLDSSIRYGREAVRLTPKDHPDRAFRLINLGSDYSLRGREDKNLDSINEAIRYFQEAVDLIPETHPNRAGGLLFLADCYDDKHDITDEDADYYKSIDYALMAFRSHASIARDRLKAGAWLLRAYGIEEQWTEASGIATEAISLISLLTPRAQSTLDRQNAAIDIAGMASDTAAVVLRAGRSAADAVEFLEMGRGIIIESLIEMRSDAGALAEEHPLMAEEFLRLRAQLEDPEFVAGQPYDEHHNAARKLDEHIGKIRSLPNFESFLKAPSNKAMMEAAGHGTIVIVNVSYYGCDGFIIDNAHIRTRHLPDLKMNDFKNYSTKRDTPEALEWLWHTIAEPILKALELFEPVSTQKWPHVRWILTGPLAKFPIHAAGVLHEGAFDGVLDRVISSYSTSVKAIIHEGRQESQEQSSDKMVLVGMQNTPQQSQLSFALEEVELVSEVCRSMGLIGHHPPPTRAPVLSALNDCNIFHFAGHGSTDSKDPLKSCLLLDDWQSSPLTIAQLLETTTIQARRPFLAYLSACGTGRIGRDELIDEGMHLVSACQLTGFRHVIGTLWEVADESCMDVAMHTYTWMRDHGMDNASVSEGLHQATRWLRSRWAKQNSTAIMLREGRLAMEAELKCSPEVLWEASVAQHHQVTVGRDIKMGEASQLSALHWVPYVHFGP